uniref:Uncharacterized protein n=1 Tax=Alexandrium monilatum TaxID=311494 RepID=A0A7S4RN14_9DINO
MPWPVDIAWVSIAVALTTAAASDVIEMDFFRAMEGSKVGVFTLENDNLASLVGVLKYVHTEVIAEHSISPDDRPKRKYSIDAIMKSRFHVKNPPSLLSPTSGMSHNVDFGGYVTYDEGVATNNVQLQHIQTYGGYVGVQEQRDVRFAYEDPYYWYSVSGFCPNLPWAQKGSPGAPSPSCLRGDAGSFVMGGLCRGSSTPTGDANCTYAYGNTSVVTLDELVGITSEDCGGRRCLDWADFRWNCTNASYRRSFDPRTGAGVAFPFCVEYDLSPACEASCEAPACAALPQAHRELGLPFWHGRCSARRNAERAERLAAALGLPTGEARGTHAPVPAPAALAVGAERCAYPGGMCNPSPMSGGMYCSRAWAGVCQPCWVPGTELAYPAADQPLCPYDVLGAVDYRGPGAPGPPGCASSRPRDGCCLYLSPSTCVPAQTTPLALLPLDDDGYAIAASRRSTTVMAAFLTRVAVEKLGLHVADAAALEEIASWEWGAGPRKGRALQAAESAMAPLLAPPTSTMTTSSTVTTAATTTSTAKPSLADATTTMRVEESPTMIPSRCMARSGLATFACALTAGLVTAVAR